MANHSSEYGQDRQAAIDAAKAGHPSQWQVEHHDIAFDGPLFTLAPNVGCDEGDVDALIDDHPELHAIAGSEPSVEDAEWVAVTVENRDVRALARAVAGWATFRRDHPPEIAVYFAVTRVGRPAQAARRRRRTRRESGSRTTSRAADDPPGPPCCPSRPDERWAS